MAKKGKLPKRIAGVKIPKKLRKRGGKVYALLQNPLVADMVAIGLLAAADAMARSKPAKKARKAANRAATEAADTTADAAGVTAIGVETILAFAAREAARAIRSSAR